MLTAGLSGSILAHGEAWKERLERRFHISHHANFHRVTSAEMGWVDVNLHDPRMIRIELTPRKIAAEQE